MLQRREILGEGDGGQAAKSEAVISHTGHRLGQGDGGQTLASMVFATRCIPINFDLNDRKVMTWILEGIKDKNLIYLTFG